MKRSRFTEEQIIGILKQHQTGFGAKELCRKHGISCHVSQVAVAVRRHGRVGCEEAERAG
ncbi:MAG: transposase [Reyranella sp.]|nr:transposase [Reyranella sp.]